MADKPKPTESSLMLKHPQFVSAAEDWQECRDCYAGERTVKAAGQKYLKPTRAMILDGMNAGDVGYQMYQAYKLRAVFHDLYKDAVEAYMGMVFNKPPVISLPDKMKNIKSNMGETPENFLRRLTEEQLVSGRAAILNDLPLEGDVNTLPYFAMYPAEAICNWNAGESKDNVVDLRYAVLDESGYRVSETDMFAWQVEARYRVVMRDAAGNYSQGLFRDLGQGVPNFDPTQMSNPKYLEEVLPFVPLVFVNSKDNLPDVDVPPLLGLARAMFAMYRGEADYRQNLFMQGQDTFVTIGGFKKDPANPEGALRMGAGARVDIEAGGDAKYVGVDGRGLPEQRVALTNDRQRAETRAGQLATKAVGDKESGDALKTRLAAQTCTLTQIAIAGAGGLERSLKNCAIWMGEDPDKVKVEPNLEFSSTLVTGQDAFQMMQAKKEGAPVSYKSLHEWFTARGVTRLNFEEELKQITKERSMVAIFADPIAEQQRKIENDQTQQGIDKPTAPPAQK